MSFVRGFSADHDQDLGSMWILWGSGKESWNQQELLGFTAGMFIPHRKSICSTYPLVMTNSLLLKMTIEIVDLPIKNGDFP